METNKYYVARWNGNNLDIDYTRPFPTLEEAKDYADEVWWPSDEIAIFKCEAVREISA